MFEQERAVSIALFMKQFLWRWLAGVSQHTNLMYPSHGSIYKLSFFFAVCNSYTTDAMIYRR